jgi:acetate kinase
MSDVILVLNAGSSSIKFSVFAQGGPELALLARGQVEGIASAPRFVAKDGEGRSLGEKRWAAGQALGHEGAFAHLAEWLKSFGAGAHRLAAVGHRVAHGGEEYAAPARVDATLLAKVDALVPLAPLHLPNNLAAIRAVLARAPQVPQVACFDTAMHRTFPRVERMLALPREYEAAGIRRYGLHGLSYEYIASVLPTLDDRAARGKTVVLHLGSGASMCALEAGCSVACTMGLTGIDGLPMGTRSGSLDPGVMLYLMDQRHMDARAIETLVWKQSGLLGVSGVASDMRALLASSEPRAALAIDLFVYRIGRELGSLAAALGGLDAIVFTAGIGENTPIIRERVCRNAAWLGVALDPVANAAGGRRITTAASRTAAWVIPTNEELMIARHTRDLLLAPG